MFAVNILWKQQIQLLCKDHKLNQYTWFMYLKSNLYSVNDMWVSLTTCRVSLINQMTCESH